MIHRTFLNPIRIVVFAGVLCGAAGIEAQSSLSLNVGQATYKINREMYGGLLENFNRDIYKGLYVGTASTVPNASGMRKDVIAAFKECGVTIMDWPGGCFAERYVWMDGIGPKSSRPGGDMVNGMGTDEYFQLCDSLNSIPYITADLSGLSAAGMAGWLNHIDSLYPNRIKYWKMGNEPWGGCGTGISISSYISKYNQYKAAIPSRFSGKFARIADGGTADYLYSVKWIDSLMKCEMGSVEGVTLHYYGAFSGSSTGFAADSYYVRIQVALGISSKLAIYDSVMAVYDPAYTVGLMVDEWGAWYSNIPGGDYPQSTCRDAVIAALNLNLFNNRCRRIKMGCVAQPVNVIQSLILTENPAVNRIVKTPTFYIYKMYKVHQAATMVPSTLSTSNNQNIPIISSSSSVDSTGILHISLCNTHATAAHTVTVTLTNAPAYSSCTATILNGPSFNSYNDFGAPENVNIQNFTGVTHTGNTVTVNMPAHSVVTVELKPAVGVLFRPVNGTNSSIAVGTAKGGTITVKSGSLRRTPFTLELYSGDGRRVVEAYKGTLEAGRQKFVWQPKNLGKGTSVFMVKMQSDEGTKCQRVLLQR